VSFYAFSVAPSGSGCKTVSIDDVKLYMQLALDAKNAGASIYISAFSQACVPGGLNIITGIIR
jgi:hypothetical protein